MEVQARLCQLAELGAGEAWEHMREIAGAVPKIAAATTVAFGLALGGLLAIGAAPGAEHATALSSAATMYQAVQGATMYILVALTTALALRAMRNSKR